MIWRRQAPKHDVPLFVFEYSILLQQKGRAMYRIQNVAASNGVELFRSSHMLDAMERWWSDAWCHFACCFVPRRAFCPSYDLCRSWYIFYVIFLEVVGNSWEPCGKFVFENPANCFPTRSAPTTSHYAHPFMPPRTRRWHPPGAECNLGRIIWVEV